MGGLSRARARGVWSDGSRGTAGVIEGHRSSANARGAQTRTRMRAVCVSYAFIIQMARLCSSSYLPSSCRAINSAFISLHSDSTHPTTTSMPASSNV